MRCIDTIQLKIKTAPEEFTSGANEKKEFNWIPGKKVHWAHSEHWPQLQITTHSILTLLHGNVHASGVICWLSHSCYQTMFSRSITIKRHRCCSLIESSVFLSVPIIESSVMKPNTEYFFQLNTFSQGTNWIGTMSSAISN